MQESLSDAYQEFQDVWPSLASAVVFLLLILWDVFMAFNRRAHWAPAQGMVLTALTIQMLGWIAAMSDISYAGSEDDINNQVADLVKKDQLLFDCGRLMMCVFIGYLLPSMVRSNWTQAWSNIGGLVLTILFRLLFEVYFVWRISDRRQSLWFAVSNTTLFMASTVLSLLLSCAVLAGKSIRSILLGKVHWALSCCPPASTDNSTSSPLASPISKSFTFSPLASPISKSFTSSSTAPSPNHNTNPNPEECKNSCCFDSDEPCKNWCCYPNNDKCENTEEHVLKCWIVARVSQPEYIMARSVFSSLAGVVVTISVLIMVVKWSCIQLPLHYGIAHKITVFVELAFILVGWMVVSFRWLTSVLYFPRKVEFLNNFEDFWTQSIAELQEDLDAQLTCRLYKEKKIKQTKLGMRIILHIITAVRLHSVILPMRVWLQVLMVWLSKACWRLSQTLMGMIRPFIMNTQKKLLYGSSWRPEGSQFHKLQKTLSFIRMPGEMALHLWTANELGFKRTQCKIEEGVMKAEKSVMLIRFIQQNTASSITFTLKNVDEKYFNRIPWKRRGASLLYCMVHLYEDANNFDGINGATRDNIVNRDIKKAVVTAYKMAMVIDHAMEACSHAWDLLDFVDSSNNMGADREFDSLINMWQEHFENLKKLKLAIEDLESQQQDGATGASTDQWDGALENWQGSKDWLRLTVYCHSYKKLYKKFHSGNNAEKNRKNAQDDDEKIMENNAQEDNEKIMENDHEKNAQDENEKIMENEENNKNTQEDEDDVKNKENVKDLEDLQLKLANVINHCLIEIHKVLREKCNKWAEESNEEEIYNAAFIAGKAKGLRRSQILEANPLFEHGISQSPKTSQGSPHGER